MGLVTPYCVSIVYAGQGCFRQEGYFHYMFGVAEEDFYGAVLRDGRAILFMPRLPPEHAVWMGPIAGTAAVSGGTHAYT